MASTRLTRTFTTPTNNKIWTLSFWVKRGSLGASQWVINTDSGNHEDRLHFNPEDRLNYYEQDSGGSELANFVPNAQLRDTNAWYHIVLTRDSTQATASDRLKMYYNGELQTVFLTNTYPSQNSSNRLNTAVEHEIGARNSSSYFDGSMSHIHFIDGTAYDASAFGETDATTGEWKIKTSPSVTYGNNGFFILKDGNSVTDQSGNSNNWTVGGGTLTKTEDNPSNVFCTWNPLDNFYQESTFAHGNTQVRGKSPGIQYGYETFNTGTLGMTSGKYYWEIKFSANDSGATEIGIVDNVTTSSSQQLQQRTYGWSYSKDGTVKNNSSSVGGTWGTYTTGDIIGVALNLDDEQDGLNKLYFSKNGVWQNGSDPSNASSVTGVVGVTKPENNSSGFYFPAGGDENAGNSTLQANFGNGYFGSTQISSAGTNASGIGIFEYDVPTGYTALSTKGLNL
jgi:hypothetical protein